MQKQGCPFQEASALHKKIRAVEDWSRRTPVDARVLRDSIKEWCANELQDTSYSRSSFTRTGATKIKITEITRVTQLQAVSLAAK